MQQDGGDAGQGLLAAAVALAAAGVVLVLEILACGSRPSTSG